MHWHAVSGSRPIAGRYALQECACVYECGLWRASAPVCICGFALESCMCVCVCGGGLMGVWIIRVCVHLARAAFCMPV